ncbi:MAG: 30S ribosomal protein S9 [Bdellovibrionales bacterium]|nr:30S ribosomal protein S9 [Bdellovibrionales bacterium]
MAAEKKVYYATGRRKTSAARVFLKSGTGKISINGVEANKYLTTATGKMTILVPFNITETHNKFDARITVLGGGSTGQAEAIRLGIARALLAVDDQYRPVLKKAGLLTRDSRMVERKKYGKHKARRSTQFSKR